MALDRQRRRPCGRRFAHGLADPGRHPADRGAGPAVQGRDRDLAAQPLPHRGDADRLRLLLWAADRFGRRERTLRQLSWRDGLLFGLAQAMALVPGVSRSGGTITAGLLMGYSREAAARYSFLLAIPAVLASGLYQLYRSAELGSPVPRGPTALATLVAFGVGYGVIVIFLKLVSSRGYLPFVVYRIVLGIGVLALLCLGVLSPL
ncbi:undecaprenyl-diphosphate phosphatase [Aquincola sp. MAHUQ-54]|uniref:Undecaprenyl-diphosphatase n=1 Tax=Aquincola agrisoli TaxID=3119538 RepID=A0AAW9Q545_9BURK